ncbi:MAG: FAD-binding protein [Candidatus Hydrogenedens sp.]|nr:FAD-binding protein [Candidatus Hydrogenedens sp.]
MQQGKRRYRRAGSARLRPMPEPDAIAGALSALLPPDRIAFSPGERARRARTTSPHGTTPAGVVWPVSTEEVSAVVAACGGAGVPVYPVSRGKNWGYGDACAPVDGCVLMDLSRMDAIESIDAELGYAVIQPGVSQGQLAAAAAERAPGYWIDCTGAGPEASLVGNVMDRGFGHTPYADHLATSSIMEAVLADGKILRPGFHRYPGAKAAPVYPYGVGPYIDGLLTQSNLAIATKVCVWLCPKPEAFRFFYIKVEDESRLEALIDALRPLRLQGILNSAVHVGNILRVVSGQRTYPRDLAGGKRPLDAAALERLRAETGLGAWSCSGSLTGTRAQVRAGAQALRRAVQGIGRVIVLSDAQIALADAITERAARFGLLRGLRKTIQDLTPHIDLLRGTPTYHPLRGALWGLDTDDDTPRDPVEAGAGLLWLSPVLPLRGADARAVERIAAPLLAQHGFDFLATFTLLNARSMVGIINIAFDTADTEAAARAGACYHELMRALIGAGYPPYRVSIEGMPLLREPGTEYDAFLGRIKAAVDPCGIIAPGRYIAPQSGDAG